eukprot:6478353-Amphidinium_carterae.1
MTTRLSLPFVVLPVGSELSEMAHQTCQEGPWSSTHPSKASCSFSTSPWQGPCDCSKRLRVADDPVRRV